MYSIVGASEGIQDATSTPPAVPAQEKKEIAQSTTETHASGQDAGAAAATSGPPKVKTEKECMCNIPNEYLLDMSLT